MESCGINSVGANQYLQDGLGHTNFTSIMEGMDNSQKALKNNLSGKIEVYNTEEYQIIKDNGIGMKNIDDNLELFKKSDDNDYTLSKCGMGLNSLLSNELGDKNRRAYIFTSYKSQEDDNDVDNLEYSIRLLQFDGLLKKETINVSKQLIKEIDKKLNGDTGTILLIVKNNNDQQEKGKKKSAQLLKEINMDKELEYDEGLMEKFSYILEGSDCNYVYNGIKIPIYKYISVNDKILINCSIYYKIKPDQEVNYYIKETKEFYTCQSSNIDQRKLSTPLNDKYINTNNLKLLGEYGVYMNNSDITGTTDKDKSYYVQYMIGNLRTIGFEKFKANNIRTESHFKYLKGRLDIEDINFIKYFLQGKKTNDDIWKIDMCDRFIKLHTILSRITTNNNILSMKNITWDYHPALHGNRKGHYDIDDLNAVKKDPKVNKDPKLVNKDPKPANKDPKPVNKDPKPANKDPKPANKDPKPANKDPKRTWSSDGKREILLKQDNKCKICNIYLDDTHIQYEFDHIIPHAQGGQTDLENGRALCRNCHKGRELPWANNKKDTKMHIEILIKLHQEALKDLALKDLALKDL